MISLFPYSIPNRLLISNPLKICICDLQIGTLKQADNFNNRFILRGSSLLWVQKEYSSYGTCGSNPSDFSIIANRLTRGNNLGVLHCKNRMILRRENGRRKCVSNFGLIGRV